MADVRQHYVPQFYLREFLDRSHETKGQNVLWLYEHGKHPTRKSVKAVGYANNFYEIPSGTSNSPIAEQPGFLEQCLQQLEARAAPTLRRLARGDFDLTAQQRGEFAGFIALSMCRTPFFASMVDELTMRIHRVFLRDALDTPGRLEKLMKEAGITGAEKPSVSVEQMRGFAERVANGRIKGEQTNRGYTMKIMFVAMRAFMEEFEKMRWGLLRAADGRAFVTSDNPVILANAGSRQSPQPKDFHFVAGTEFWFPVGRLFLLNGIVDDGPDRTGQATSQLMDAMQQAQVIRARKQVYASFNGAALYRQVATIHAARGAMVPDLPDEWFRPARDG